MRRTGTASQPPGFGLKQLLCVVMAASIMIHASEPPDAGAASSTWEQADNFMWEPTEPKYLEPVPGNPADCCGSELVGDPEFDEPPYACDCDLTYGACNVGCCCDPECAAIDRQDVFGCTSNTSAGEKTAVRTCSGDLVTVNLPQSATSRGWGSYTDVDGVLCIVTDNSPSRGSFYRDPEAESDLSPNEVAEEIAKEGAPLFSAWAAPPLVASSTGYALNDTVLGDGCVSASSANGCSSRAPTLLPAALPNGVCHQTRWIPFLINVDPYDCLPAAGTLEEQCASERNANASFSLNSKFAPAPSASVAMRPLRYFVSRNSSVHIEIAPSALPSATFDAASGECRDSLSALQYRFFVDGATGVITDARVYMELRDVDSVTPQTFGAAFEFTDQEALDTPRDVSGRPGYIRGRPLLIADGALTSLRLRTGALEMLPRSNLGACIQSTAESETAPRSTSLLFGEAASAHCYEEFESASALQQWCTPTPLPQLPLIAALNLSWQSPDGALAYVGAYGDAHPGALADWTPLSLAPDTTLFEREWHAPSQSCRNVLALFEVQVLYAEVGSAEYPYKKVLGAQLKLTAQTVRARRCVASTTPCVTRAFSSAATSFVALSEDGRAYDFVPPLPKLIKLPADFFSPFVATDDSTDSSTGAQGRRARRLRQVAQQASQPQGSTAGSFAVIASIPIAAVLAALLGRSLAANT